MDVQHPAKSAATSDPWRLYRAFDLLRSLHQHFYDQAKTADQKAGYILTFLTILFAYSKENGNILLFLNGHAPWSVAWFLSLVFAGAAGFSMLCTGLVFLPRTKSAGSAMFWASWLRRPVTSDQLMREDADQFIMAEYLKDIENLAVLCNAKYRFVKLAFRGTGATIVCYFLIVVLTR
jgi:hypothetical protein